MFAFHTASSSPSTASEARESGDLTWCVVVGHLHVQRAAAVSKVFGNEHGALLADEQRGRVGVASDVVGADGQVGDLKALDAVNIQSFVQHAVFDDGVALLGGHGTGAERVPGRLDVSLDPFLNVRDVFRGVFQILAQVVLVAAENVGRWAAPRLKWH